MVGSLPTPYVGDPLALEGASARLRRGLGLRVLSVAVAPASWQSKFISDLNRTFPGQQHRLTSLKVAGLDAIRCHGIPRDLIVATDMLLLDPGGESSAHFADDIRAIEEFYGLPAAWLGGRRTHSNNDEEDGVVALLRQRVVAGAKGALGGGWHLPRRRMILESASSAGAAASCPSSSSSSSSSSVSAAAAAESSSTRAMLRCTSWVAGASDGPASCAHRLRLLSPPSRTHQGGTTPTRTDAPDKPGPCQQKGLGSECPAFSADKASALLPPSLLSRTRAHDGSGRAWARVVQRLDAGLPVTVAVLGGSMSLSHKRGWSELVLEWMQATWPRSTITLHNGAIGATGSTFFALCSESRLPRKGRVDLIFLEHALNDGESWPPAADWESMRPRATIYEVLVRSLLRRAPAAGGSPALVFLNWDRIGWCANMEANPRTYVSRLAAGTLGNAIRGVPWLATPQVAVDLVARWYGLPSLAPRNAIWHRDCDDESFRGAFCDSGGVVGCGHLRPLGHAMVARVITSFLEESTARARQQAPLPPSPQPPPGALAGDEPLPPPIFEAVAKADQPGATAQCTRGEEMKALRRSVAYGDWAYVRRDPRQPAGADKPGLLSLTAPSALEIEIGRAPAGVVSIGFLRSYDERMGWLHARCIGGCSCVPSRMEGWHSRRSSVLAFGMVTNVTAGAAGMCTLHLTHYPRGASRAAGNTSSKFKLLALVVPRVAIDPGEQDKVGRSFS